MRGHVPTCDTLKCNAVPCTAHHDTPRYERLPRSRRPSINFLYVHYDLCCDPRISIGPQDPTIPPHYTVHRTHQAQSCRDLIVSSSNPSHQTQIVSIVHYQSFCLRAPLLGQGIIGKDSQGVKTSSTIQFQTSYGHQWYSQYRTNSAALRTL